MAVAVELELTLVLALAWVLLFSIGVTIIFSAGDSARFISFFLLLLMLLFAE